MINRSYALLWIGKLVSQLGDKFYAIALAWWILQKTDSPSIMGLFLLVSVLPGVLAGFFTGALADRWIRKNMLIATDIIRGGLVMAISLLSYRGMLEIWHVFAIGFCLSVAAAFFDPAVQAVIPEIVRKEELPKANGLSQMVSGFCTVAGPLSGAFAVSLAGVTWVFFANGVSYFISALLACFIVTCRSVNTTDRGNLLREIQEGMRFIRSRRRITLLLKVIAAAHFFMGSLMVSLPFLAKGLQGTVVKNLGFLEMAVGIGLIAGSVFMSTRKKGSINEGSMLLFIIAMGFCFAAACTVLLLAVKMVYAYMAILVLMGVCISSASVFWQTLLQSCTPGNMTGRVFSIATLIGNTSLPMAYGIFGLLLGIGSMPAVMGACGVCLMALGIIFRSSIKTNAKSEAEILAAEP